MKFDPLDGETWGLVRHRHHLAYGVGHGRLMWLPCWLKRAIITAWNHTTCALLGHDVFGPYLLDHDVVIDGKRTRVYPATCSACSKRFPEAEREP